MENKGVYWFYLVGFSLILALPLLNLAPWFSPPDWGKTIVFRIILSILIFVFLYEIISEKQFPIKTSLPFWLLVSLLGIYFLATIFSLDRNFSFWGSPYRSGGFLNFAFYIVFAILAFLILGKEDWQKIWNFAIVIGILVSIIAFFQQYGLFSKILIPFKNRPPSTLGGTISLAIYLLLLSFLTLSFGFETKKRVKKIFYFFSFLLFTFVIIFTTQTRGAIIGLVVGFFYLFFFFPFKKRSISLILKIIISVLLVLGICEFYYLNTRPIPKFIQENNLLSGITQRILIKNIISDARFSAWKVSWQALKARPILGYGPENFSIGFDKYYDPSLAGIEKSPGDTPSSWWDRAHNFIFDISITTGIPALIIYLALFGTLFCQLEKLKRRRADKALILNGIQATFLSCLVANFSSFDTFPAYLMSFLLIGYSLSLINEDLSEKTFSFNTKGKNIVLAIIFGGIFYFVYLFNIKPLEINKEIKIARAQSDQQDYKGAVTRMENLLKSHSFLDAYRGLNYIEIISQAIDKASEKTQIMLAKKAIAILKENTKIQPYYTRSWMRLGNYTNVLIEKGQKDLKNEAIYYFEKAEELSPKRQEAYIGLVTTNLLTEDYKNAEEKAKKCLDLNQNLGECWWLMALANIHLNKNEEAQENIKIAGQKNYNISSENSLLQLANAYSENKDYQQLAKIYKNLTIANPNNVQYYASLAVAYKEIGDFKNARAEALRALELSPQSKSEIETFLKTLPQ